MDDFSVSEGMASSYHDRRLMAASTPVSDAAMATPREAFDEASICLSASRTNRHEADSSLSPLMTPLERQLKSHPLNSVGPTPFSALSQELCASISKASPQQAMEIVRGLQNQVSEPGVSSARPRPAQGSRPQRTL